LAEKDLLYTMLERLRNEGKDVEGAIQARDVRAFEMAEARIDCYYLLKRIDRAKRKQTVRGESGRQAKPSTGVGRR